MAGEMENSEAKVTKVHGEERGKGTTVPLQIQDRFTTAGVSSYSVLSELFYCVM